MHGDHDLCSAEEVAPGLRPATRVVDTQIAAPRVTDLCDHHTNRRAEGDGLV
jgi:hypothetical protein